MCGIFSLFNFPNSFIDNQYYYQIINDSFTKGSSRGPEFSSLNKFIDYDSLLGFHRLAINGLDPNSHQPIHVNNIILICNGEIYNYKHIYDLLNINPKTNSDCEAIIYAYQHFGIDGCLQLLDGVFSFVLIDTNNMSLHIARDPFGVRPLYLFQGLPIDNNLHKHNKGKSFFGFSSEMKMITPLNEISNIYSIQQFNPGSYLSYSYDNNHKWIKSFPITKYISPSSYINSTNSVLNVVLDNIYQSLNNSVLKRVITTDRPIACLLSGGLDSSLIASLVSKYYKEQNKQLETYSIGMQGSVDLKYAKIVAEFIGSKHHEIVVSEDDFLNAIPQVINAIESYDTTTVRASVGNYLVAKYISENSDAKVIFNGDGADEVCGGYMYFHAAPNMYAFDFECKRLLNDISFFDVLRSDRSISSNGLEPRTPFLDNSFIQTYFSIDKELRFNLHKNKCEKYLLRKAFDNGITLPDEVLWRTKEAFSDGVSSSSKSWFEVIKDHVDTYLSSSLPSFDTLQRNIPDTFEKKYYRHLFHKFYTDKYDNVIPYYWMPKFIQANDASARTLDIYKNKMNNTQ
jgi:asparagine synthase (glutamine-hydrolysing)